MGIDAVTAACMLFLSYWFIEFIDQTGRARELWWLLPVASIVTVSTFYFTGLYKEGASICWFEILRRSCI